MNRTKLRKALLLFSTMVVFDLTEPLNRNRPNTDRVDSNALILEPINQFNRGKLFQFSASDCPETAFHQTEPNRKGILVICYLMNS